MKDGAETAIWRKARLGSVTETEEKTWGFSLVESLDKLRSGSRENGAKGREDYLLVVPTNTRAKKFTFRRRLNYDSGN